MRSKRWLSLCLVLLLHAGNTWAYWQQDVKYRIDVRLDTEKHTLQGREVLEYTNNSPDTLEYVWFHLYPNAYKNNETVFAKELRRLGSGRFHFASEKDRGYIDILSLKAQGKELRWEYKKGDITEAKVYLPSPLYPGEKVTFEIEFFLKIPLIFSRLGHVGRHYEITQWYPKIVVYDEKGWHPDGYHAVGEFYGEFGTFDVRITLPKDLVVGATGVLIAPESEKAWLDSLAAEGARIEKMADKERKRYLKERDKRIKRTRTRETKTLHFHAEKVHDFAWFADSRYILKRGEFEGIQINVLVRPEHERMWKDAIQYVHDTLKYYGEWYGRYPYPQITVVDGDLRAGGGMEYPNIVVIAMPNVPFFNRFLEMVIMHEVGHQWFYGVLGTNEMDEAWMDEGINSYSENRYLERKYGKEGNMTNWPKALSFLPQISDRWMQTISYYTYASQNHDEPILKPAYKFEEAYFPMVYHKAARMMDMLNYLLGEETFNRVMQAYFEEWKFKHPDTQDFIEVAERVSGRELDWFFHQWLETTKKCDYAVGKVKTRRTPEGYETSVQVRRLGEVIMPVDVLVVTRDGKRCIQRWDGRDGGKTLHFKTEAEVDYVEVDPDHRLLEIDHWNNRKPRKVEFGFLDLPSFYTYQIYYRPSLWYEDDVDGLRLGLGLRGGIILSRRNIFSLGCSYAFDSKRVNYSASYTTVLPSLHKSAALSLSVKDLEGWRRYWLELKLRFGKYLHRNPSHNLQLGLGQKEVYDLGYYNEADWEEGKITTGELRYTYTTTGVHLSTRNSLTVQRGVKVLGGGFDFEKYSLELQYRVRWNRWMRTHIRLFCGVAFGDLPSQERFYLAGDLDPDFKDRLIMDRRGRYTPLEKWYVKGGGNLRGYYGDYYGGQHPSGRAILAINVEIPLPKIPFSLFYDVGDVWGDAGAMNLGDLRSDAGLGLGLGPLKVQFPLWVSDPPTGVRNFKFRWLVGLSFGGFGIRI